MQRRKTEARRIFAAGASPRLACCGNFQLGQSILCCGGFHVDHLIRCREPFCPGTSNPVRVQAFTGGVAGNVSRGLALLGHEVSLLSVVGDDAEGARLLTEAATLGIDTTLVQRLKGCMTPHYWATLDQSGELIAGFADTGLYETLDATAWDLGQSAGGWGWRLLDANFPESVMARLIHAQDGARIVGATVSVAKAGRWRNLRDRLSILVTNRRELAALSGRRLENMRSIRAACETLLGGRLETVIVTLGALGAVLCTQGAVSHWSAVETSIGNVNGAGDAFLAGFLGGLGKNEDLEQCMRTGLALASLVASAESPHLSVLDDALFNRRRAQIRRDHTP